MEINGLDQLKNIVDNSLEREASEYTDDNVSEKDWQQRKWTEGTYINCDLRYYHLASLGKFDVVLVDPPWYLFVFRRVSLFSVFHSFSLSFFSLPSLRVFSVGYRTL
jgi:hypothetical protein